MLFITLKAPSVSQEVRKNKEKQNFLLFTSVI